MSFVYLKTADTDWPIHQLLSTRWSPRAFDPDKEIGAEDLRALLEAARWAASSYNAQPWRFLLARRRQEAQAFKATLALLTEPNQRWARQASALMIGVFKDDFDDGRPNPHATHDLGAAMANLTLEATARGLIAHQMAGFDRDAARHTFGIPAGYTPHTAIALGHQAAPDTLPEDLRQREVAPRQRKPQDEFVFTGSWQEVYEG